MPCPTSTRPVLIVAVLSAWIAMNESTWPRLNRSSEANGFTAAAPAFPAKGEAHDQRTAAQPRRTPLGARTCSCSFGNDEVVLVPLGEKNVHWPALRSIVFTSCPCRRRR